MKQLIVEVDGQLFIPMEKLPKEFKKLKLKSGHVTIQNEIKPGSELVIEGIEFTVGDFEINTILTSTSRDGRPVSYRRELTLKAFTNEAVK